MGRGVWRPGNGSGDFRSAASPQPWGDDPRRQLPADGEAQIRAVSPADRQFIAANVPGKGDALDSNCRL